MRDMFQLHRYGVVTALQQIRLCRRYLVLRATLKLHCASNMNEDDVVEALLPNFRCDPVESQRVPRKDTRASPARATTHGSVVHSHSSVSTSTQKAASSFQWAPYVTVRRQGELGIEWKCCSCGQFNKLGDKQCSSCQADSKFSIRSSFSPSRQVTVFPTAWICEACEQENVSTNQTEDSRAKFFCSSCKAPFKGVHEWICPMCEAENSRASVQCSSCARQRPVSWDCRMCGKKNSIFSPSCVSCKAKNRSKSSAGLQKCPYCGTNNDARFEICECCVAPLDRMRGIMSPNPDNSSPASESRKLKDKEVDMPGSERSSVASSNYSVSARKFRDATLQLSISGNTDEAVDGSWWCPDCNIILRRNATFCDICLRSRGGKAAAKNARVTKALQPGDWQCPYCRQFRSVSIDNCCGKAREVPLGYWLCQNCKSTNHRNRQVCIGCGKSPPGKVWHCLVCGTANTVSHYNCSVCASSHPLLWRCAKCSTPQHFSVTRCVCGAVRPKPITPSVCQVCGAPNAINRKTCFRCRARLEEGNWKCQSCGEASNPRAVHRCTVCLSPRRYNHAEVTWVCALCGMAVASGGDLPERHECPKCGAQCSSACLKVPSRWICQQCKLESNRGTSPKCMECGAPRTLRSFQTLVTCPHCFRETVMNEKEKCSLCQGSLSGLLNSHGEIVKASEEEMSEISLNELPDADLEKAEYTTQTKENNTIMI